MGVRTTVYIPDDLYEWWVQRTDPGEVVLSDFVREGLAEARKRSRAEGCVHPVATCGVCGTTLEEDPEGAHVHTQ